MIINIFATIIILFLIPIAFNPKYRYNEHQTWEPDGGTIFIMISLAAFLIWVVWR